MTQISRTFTITRIKRQSKEQGIVTLLRINPPALWIKGHKEIRWSLMTLRSQREVISWLLSSKTCPSKTKLTTQRLEHCWMWSSHALKFTSRDCTCLQTASTSIWDYWLCPSCSLFSLYGKGLIWMRIFSSYLQKFCSICSYLWISSSEWS